MNLTPLGVSTYAPTVHSALNLQLQASAQGSTPATARAFEDYNGAWSDGRYTVTGTTDLMITASIYLLGIGDIVTSEGGSGVMAPVRVRGEIAGLFVEASYVTGTDQWSVTSNIPGVPPFQSLSGINSYFRFSFPILPGTPIEMRAFVDELGDDARVTAPPGEFANLQYFMQATTWAVATPIGQEPLDGDFDGDGDVDGDDLTVWQGRFGAGPGGAPAFGDADFDGDVDGRDFLIWQRNFGATQVTPSLSAIPEPGPGSLLLCATFLGFRARPRSKR